MNDGSLSLDVIAPNPPPQNGVTHLFLDRYGATSSLKHPWAITMLSQIFQEKGIKSPAVVLNGNASLTIRLSSPWSSFHVCFCESREKKYLITLVMFWIGNSRNSFHFVNKSGIIIYYWLRRDFLGKTPTFPSPRWSLSLKKKRLITTRKLINYHGPTTIKPPPFWSEKTKDNPFTTFLKSSILNYYLNPYILLLINENSFHFFVQCNMVEPCLTFLYLHHK